jgi:hypothetical protein
LLRGSDGLGGSGRDGRAPGANVAQREVDLLLHWHHRDVVGDGTRLDLLMVLRVLRTGAADRPLDGHFLLDQRLRGAARSLFS